MIYNEALAGLFCGDGPRRGGSTASDGLEQPEERLYAIERAGSASGLERRDALLQRQSRGAIFVRALREGSRAARPAGRRYAIQRASVHAARDAARSVREQLRAQTLSNRQRATQSLRHRTGEPEITREKHARQIRSGERRYESSRSRHLQQRVRPSEERRRASPKETLIVIQPGGSYADVTLFKGSSDATKVRVRNIAMAEARPRDGQPGNLKPLERFRRRYKRHYVTDVETGERVDLIMSREDLDRSKEQMNSAIRDEVDRRYAEDMADA